jgi:hypothetical protein
LLADCWHSFGCNASAQLKLLQQELMAVMIRQQHLVICLASEAQQSSLYCFTHTNTSALL